jgi:hypothetical protein
MSQANKQPVVKILPAQPNINNNLKRIQKLKEERPLMTSTPLIDIEQKTLGDELL